MIDTDRYYIELNAFAEANLIADAPLLLAEVERLHELKIAEEDELEKLCNRAEFYEEEYNLVRREKQELLAEVKRLREGIKEQMQVALDCVGSDIGDLYETIADDLRRLIE